MRILALTLSLAACKGRPPEVAIPLPTPPQTEPPAPTPPTPTPAPSEPPAEPTWTWLAPGDLGPGQGLGEQSAENHAPDMVFPIAGAAWANSQVYGVGGWLGPAGGECDPRNYSGPWRDTWCEHRDTVYSMPTCPVGRGHSGVDVRPERCEDATFDVLAAEDGTITYVGGYSVKLRSADGDVTYQYLHMQHDLQVNQPVTKGQRIGSVSNVFGDTPTTLHLHFGLKRHDFVNAPAMWVSPYEALRAAYERGAGPGARLSVGAVTAHDATSIAGWARDPAHPDAPIQVTLHLDGKAEPVATKAADQTLDGVSCGGSGPCASAFRFPLPADAGAEWVQVYGWIDGTPVLLDGGQLHL